MNGCCVAGGWRQCDQLLDHRRVGVPRIGTLADLVVELPVLVLVAAGTLAVEVPALVLAVALVIVVVAVRARVEGTSGTSKLQS